ncbi:glutathione hydrolase 1 proenzyme-like, partial [Mytilus californianus]|uniref:glutathione hydrolase 1 proenzyme-like n=1 Tax=Mytilus californianus TaxID=6549 RepID=UPI0022461BFD
YELISNLLLAFFIVIILAAILQSKEGSGQPRKITVRKGAVGADHEVCSRIGKDVLVDGGSAVDAAIATLLCNGVMAPHNMGIGGGCFMVIYDAQNKKTLVVDGRETAPLSSSQETFVNESGYIGKVNVELKDITGPQQDSRNKGSNSSCEIFCDEMGNSLPEGTFVQWPRLAET